MGGGAAGFLRRAFRVDNIVLHFRVTHSAYSLSFLLPHRGKPAVAITMATAHMADIVIFDMKKENTHIRFLTPALL